MPGLPSELEISVRNALVRAALATHPENPHDIFLNETIPAARCQTR
ncbi:hypothetical protein JMJ77_0003081 [Colletotrichum scovillei]|uniref:Uncharacterized protein n=1 Tax=Colletotrichum scovillei TaxID=1209932 RepID=A0A9P7U7N6_9PEZI|nr:hypothetical protein JMJ78_0006290 [Colletotrichum scovillei]KAG7043375.1 hypothetical protein JMJ77_0003081 [Colletotrichum scovillei]KAG7062823.1 hypothetical protein JMJ76_0009666 [Colletotrichum scovillei]